MTDFPVKVESVKAGVWFSTFPPTSVFVANADLDYLIQKLRKAKQEKEGEDRPA